MKIRNGFVSNSSSSSFVIIAKRISSRELLDVKNPYFWGEELGGGTDFFQLDAQMIKRILAPDNEIVKCEGIYEVYNLIGESEARLKREDLPDEMVIFPCEVDYHVTCDYEDFVERYVEMNMDGKDETTIRFE